VIVAQARCRKPRALSRVFSQRIRIRLKPLGQRWGRSTTQRQAVDLGVVVVVQAQVLRAIGRRLSGFEAVAGDRASWD